MGETRTKRLHQNCSYYFVQLKLSCSAASASILRLNLLSLTHRRNVEMIPNNDTSFVEKPAPVFEDFTEVCDFNREPGNHNDSDYLLSTEDVDSVDECAMNCR